MRANSSPEAGLNFAVWSAFAHSQDWTIGSTKNAQTYETLLRAATLGVAATDAVALIEQLVVKHGGRLVPRDIRHQCARAYSYVGSAPASVDLRRFTPDASGNLLPTARLGTSFNRDALAKRASAFAGVVTRDFLSARSTSRPSWWRDFLSGLYRPKDVVLVYDNMRSSTPLRLRRPYPRTISGPDGIWFLSNAVDGRSHLNTEGKPSWRCGEAVTDFRHLVLECDKAGDGIEEDWLRFLVLLPMPIRAIYTSGGKSVHALVAVNATSKADWDRIVGPLKRPLAECGADPGAMSAVRLTRLPFCFRESTGRQQELLYYRPEADGSPIAMLEVVA